MSFTKIPGVLAASVLALGVVTIVACSSSSSSSGTASADDAGTVTSADGGAGPTVPADSGPTDSGAADSGGDAAEPPEVACLGKSQCALCCAQLHVDGARTSFILDRQVLCEPELCATECATTFCATPRVDADAPCEACYVAKMVYDKIRARCAADPECAAFQKCYDDAKCKD